VQPFPTALSASGQDLVSLTWKLGQLTHQLTPPYFAKNSMTQWEVIEDFKTGNETSQNSVLIYLLLEKRGQQNLQLPAIEWHSKEPRV
jgi:hypothetical protein